MALTGKCNLFYVLSLLLKERNSPSLTIKSCVNDNTTLQSNPEFRIRISIFWLDPNPDPIFLDLNPFILVGSGSELFYSVYPDKKIELFWFQGSGLYLGSDPANFNLDPELFPSAIIFASLKLRTIEIKYNFTNHRYYDLYMAN